MATGRTCILAVHARSQKHTCACTPRCMTHTEGHTHHERNVHACKTNSYSYIYNQTFTKVKKRPSFLHAKWHLGTRVFLHPPRTKHLASMVVAIPGKRTNSRFHSGYNIQWSTGIGKMVANDHLHNSTGERLTASVTFLNSR